MPVSTQTVPGRTRCFRWPRCVLLALAGVFPMLVPAPSALAREVSKEYRIKAAFLYNFTKFVEWPPERFPSADAPVLIGVLGGNPFERVLEETVRGKTVNGRPVRIVPLDDARKLGGVHVVFLADRARSCSGEFAQAPTASVLTVGECDDDEDCGAVINFRTVGDKVRFEINITAAEARGLKLSAHLQKLATSVHRKPAE